MMVCMWVTSPIRWFLAAFALVYLHATNLPFLSGEPNDAGPRQVFEVVHEGFDTFSQGEFEHAGENLYVSKKGRIQLIHRWDLNNDGYFELVFSNSHNDISGSVDALGYLQTARGFRSAISPVYDSISLYDLWRQEEKSRDHVVRFPSASPSAVTFHDVDQDGLQEIIFACSSSGDAVRCSSLIYWGGPQGYRPQARVELPTVGARDLAVADLNQDGYPEIVFANEGDRYLDLDEGSYIYWGSADRYGTHARSIVPTMFATSCAVGDLDEDGHPELVFAEMDGDQGRLSIFPGTKKGPDFEADIKLETSELGSVRVFRCPEWGVVLLAVSVDDIRIYGLESGRVELKKRVEFGGARAMLADLDDDGRTDMVVASGDQSAILWGKSDWSVSSKVDLPTLEAEDVAVADLDQDGRLDIAFANHSEGAYGNLDVCSYIYWGKPWGYGVEARTDLQTFGASAVTIGDINRDDRPDVLFGNSGSGIHGGKGEHVYVYWGRPHRGYSPASMSRYPCVMAMATALADMDDDDHVELFIANAARHYSGEPGASYIYWGAPSGPSLQDRRDIPMHEAGAFAIGDLDRDGFLDAVANDLDSLVILRGSTQGLTHRPTRIEGVATSSQICRLVDFNRDGWLDIVVPDVRGQRTRVLLGGHRKYSLDHSTWIDEAHVSNVEFADLDRDGILDMILMRSYGGNGDRLDSWIRIYFGEAEGFSPRPRFEFPTSGAFDVVVADLDLDADLDMAVSQYSSRERRNLPVLLFWNDGSGDFSSKRHTRLPGEAPAGLLAADFDEDRYPDLLVFNHKTTYKENNHSNESFLYWGSPEGYSIDNRSFLPAHGPHFMQNVDVGNLATRKFEESYVSVPIKVQAAQPMTNLVLSFKAETPRGSALRFDFRSAATPASLDEATWLGIGENGHVALKPDDRWLQYRATLIAGRGYATPILTKVAIREAQQ